jgi:aminoglycoside phosphotransferase (APT) family kinase protein
LTPRYLHRVPDSPASAHGYAAYRYIPGRALDPGVLTRKERDGAAERIALFLKSLHGLTTDPAVAGLLPREDEQLAARSYLARAEGEIVPRLERPAADTLVKVFETHLGTPGNLAQTPVVLHADFSADHVLMAESTVTGVIDFGDVNWGDADYDFMYLFVDAGPDFVEEVARRYAHQSEQCGSEGRGFFLRKVTTRGRISLSESHVLHWIGEFDVQCKSPVVT